EVGARAREAASAEAREGLIAVIYGAVASAGLALLAATRIATNETIAFFRVSGNAESGVDLGWSLALLGVGHLVGLSVGLAMLVGLLISWAGAVPILTALHPALGVSIADHAQGIWSHDVRFIGAGTIAVAAIWTLLKLGGPVVGGVMSTLGAAKASKAGTHDRKDTDMGIGSIGALAVGCLFVIGYLLAAFLAPTPLAGLTTPLIIAGIPFIFIGGFLVAAICGYMAGLIGASNSPISGVGILAILICAGIMLAVAQPGADGKRALVAYALFATSIVFAIATISNNNLQDLKTGQLVGATPAAQQWALIVGVIAGAAVIPPVLNLLAHAFGFAGAANIGTVTKQPLAAPQAVLISALAQGVIEHNLNLTMIGIGAAIGVAIIIIDEVLGVAKLMRLPPLAVGIGIYLPMSATQPVVVGAIIGHLYDRWTARAKEPARAKQLGVLVASGMIVGESLFGVILAGLIVAFSSDAPLALVGGNFRFADVIGLGVFAFLIAVLYRWMMKKSR
ncbi:MAG: oligopeptide transporter, OPT family, partial [Alphaproteobacteria bacterium]|nr:oligopeptide transporter, OPT family [Alphaproteobacteria bacterium]